MRARTLIQWLDAARLRAWTPHTPPWEETVDPMRDAYFMSPTGYLLHLSRNSETGKCGCSIQKGGRHVFWSGLDCQPGSPLAAHLPAADALLRAQLSNYTFRQVYGMAKDGS